MSIETLSSGASSSRSESFSFVVDYDTVAETIGLTCTGTGHAELAVIELSNGQTLGALYCDQYGTSAGPIAQAGATDNAGQPNAGESASPVTYSGSRVIVLGPGASGVDVTGAALSTQKVPSSVVGVISPPKGTKPGLNIALSWGPNSGG